MKFLTFTLVALMLPSTSHAQTHIGSVTLTPAARTPRPSAPTQASATTADPATSTPVPAGMRELRGRITAPAEGTRLPAGNHITVSIRDAATGRTALSIQFSTTRLSTPYQMIFSPNRIASTRAYAVQAAITDTTGKVIYRSAALALPNATRATLNIPVSAP